MKNSVKKAVIPCAGYGTRLLPASKIVPKELMPVFNKPAIQCVVEELASVGITHVVLICNPRKPSIINHFNPDSSLVELLLAEEKEELAQGLRSLECLVNISVVYQENATGLGDAIMCAKDKVDGSQFLVALPDIIVADVNNSTSRLLNAVVPESAGVILLQAVEPQRVPLCGMVSGHYLSEGQFKISGAIEKPKETEIPSNLAIMGRYVFSSEIFSLMNKLRPTTISALLLTKAINQLAKTHHLLGAISEGPIFDIGSFDGMLAASTYFGQKYSRT
jgi:UTP--glucose-1-phosphate uridylyltransferase